jgi:putative DNA primase/helicase
MIDIKRIQDALYFIDPIDRDTWVRMSMAVKNGLGEDGFDIWNNWSQGADSYNTIDAKSVWRSSKAFGGISLASLFFEAKANGWSDDSPRLSPKQEVEAKHKADTQRLAEKAAEAFLRHNAATKAAEIWKKATLASTDHAYLKIKGIQPNGVRQRDFELIIPVSINGKLTSLQMINSDGSKRFMKNGAMRAGHYIIGDAPNAQILCIAEGFATASTIHETTGLTTATAFNASNLEPVAKAIRKKYPDHVLIICGDDDVNTLGNPGRTKAQQAALAVGGLAVFPFFSDLSKRGSDFNDLAQFEGLQAVRDIIKTAAASMMGDLS